MELVFRETYFIPFAEVLARHFDVRVLDLPGYGKTPRPDHALSPIELAGIVARYLEKINVGSAKGIPYEYNHTLIKGDYAFLEWTAEGKDKAVYDGADSFVIKNGKIILQTIHYSVTQ